MSLHAIRPHAWRLIWTVAVSAPLLVGGRSLVAADDATEEAAGRDWVSLISDDWTAWTQRDRRIQWAGDARLRSENPRRLEAEAGDAVLVVERRAQVAPLVTHESFGDCELHFEFMVAKGSNSGVKLHGHYEIQIYDSYGKTDKLTGSDCGGVYPRWQYKNNRFTYLDEGIPPLVNASKEPGQWQTCDVTFRAPRFGSDGEKIENARFEIVTLNDEVIHRNAELKTPTGMVGQATEAEKGPLLIQVDHGPVAFRNIRIRSLTGEHGEPEARDAEPDKTNDDDIAG